MYLHPQPRKKNGIEYMYYSIAESYRIKGYPNPKRRILFRIGKLTPLQAQQIRNVLEVTKSPDAFVTTFGDILFKDHWRYLDVAFVGHLWDQWGLSNLFPTDERAPGENNGKCVSTSKIAKMLTIYHCLDPGSYLSAVIWFKSTVLDFILKIDKSRINKTRIYDELDKIEECKGAMQKYLYKTLRERDKKTLMIVLYDLTDSYFHGRKCELAKPGITKNNGFQGKKIVLALLVNSDGYPFAWDVLEDYTADVTTLKDLSDKLKAKFNISDYEIILVFDRGMVSDENLRYMEEKKRFYISALDKNQIPNIKVCLFGLRMEHKQYLKDGIVGNELEDLFSDNGISLSSKAKITRKGDKHWNIRDGDNIYDIKGEDQLNVYGNIDLEPFTQLEEDNAVEEVLKMGFKKHDDISYYKKFRGIDGRRYVLIFNPEMFGDERKTREENIRKGLGYLKEENKLLGKAKKSRNEQTTEGKIDKKLKDAKAHNFVDYELKPVTVKAKDGYVKSFKIIPEETEKTKKAIKKAKRADGLWMMTTNVPDKEKDKNGFTEGELIDNYRNKNRVEEAFRDVKAFIDIEPFRVWTKEHVGAHYTICVLSHLLNVTVTNKLREHAIDGITSVHKAYEKLRKYEAGEIEVKGTKHAGKKITDPRTIPKNVIELLDLFKCKHLINNEHLKSIKIEGGL